MVAWRPTASSLPEGMYAAPRRPGDSISIPALIKRPHPKAPNTLATCKECLSTWLASRRTLRSAK